MNPILGIIASSKLGVSGAYESIATTTLGSSASSVTFSSIPSTYTHLQIRVLAQNSVSGDYDWSLRFNSDTGANYSKHQLYGDGTTAYATGSASQNQIPGGFMYLTSWSTAIVDVLDYTSTTKNKTVRLLTGSDNNGGGFSGFRSGVWFATPAAITSITIIPTSGGSGFLTNSSFALYGIKGA